MNAEEDPYATPTEDFSVSELKNGYSLSDAQRLHDAWTLEKFLNITESGAYSYFHLSEFLPHAVISRDGPVAELAQARSQIVGNTSLSADTKNIRFEDMITSPDSPVQGVMVVKKGKVVYEMYPGMRRTDRHAWMSNAKVFAGLLIAMLEEEGKIDVQKTVSDYLVEAKKTAWAYIKVIDILNMQTGLDLEENPASRSGNTPYNVFVRAEVGLPAPDGTTYTHNQALYKIPKLREPGERFEYSSANTQMLGLIIEAVTQKRLAELISEKIWIKSGMEGDASLGLSPQGNGIIHGLISSRLSDMARFGMLFTPSWKQISKEQIVSDAVIKKMQTSGISDNFLKGSLGPRLTEEFREQPLSNTYQWDAVFKDGDLYKSGMNGQGLYVSPATNTVVAWFATGFSEIPMEAFSRTIVQRLATPQN
ncbi:beta-lactamase family protein [Microbulbifer agarilyticus]|uniref:serine hydrolase domain-containing protein n=1 Tax=Microbulbifer agarilyticus TaxID=260552 RepID=UPI001C9483A2|nr:serine hydrolase [Microbulbifer agarilyticus]MBY6189684.1 beta-lactamase family protein [Microbulbifer agarilyticus]